MSSQISLLFPTYWRQLPALRRTLPYFQRLYPWATIHLQIGDYPEPRPETWEFIRDSGLSYALTDWDDLAMWPAPLALTKDHPEWEGLVALPYFQAIQHCQTDWFFSIDGDCGPIRGLELAKRNWIDELVAELEARPELLSVAPQNNWTLCNATDAGQDERFLYHRCFGSGAFLGNRDEFMLLDYDKSFNTRRDGSPSYSFESLVTGDLRANEQKTARLRRIHYRELPPGPHNLTTPTMQAQLDTILQEWEDSPRC